MENVVWQVLTTLKERDSGDMVSLWLKESTTFELKKSALRLPIARAFALKTCDRKVGLDRRTHIYMHIVHRCCTTRWAHSCSPNHPFPFQVATHSTSINKISGRNPSGHL